ncbi:MAG: helix-turn-helix transcriptional regulator [Clostridiales bacterium]|nr:helix-turn-helix transcriptional regulator [Clostridiales bacterium]
MVDYRLLGAHIRRVRKERGMTQAQLADAVQVSASFLGHIERGSRVLSVNTLVSLARCLGISLDELLAPARLPWMGGHGRPPLKTECADQAQ